MLRWYLSQSPHFYSDWLWPYCVKVSLFSPFHWKIGHSILYQLNFSTLFYSCISAKIWDFIHTNKMYGEKLLMGKSVNPSWTDPSVQQFCFALVRYNFWHFLYGYCCNTTCFYHISLCLLDELAYVGGAAKASWMASNGVGIETKAKPTKHSHMWKKN